MLASLVTKAWLRVVQVIPNVQSLTADYYRAEDRGKVFGTLHLTSAAGAALGGLYATNVGVPGVLFVELD